MNLVYLVSTVQLETEWMLFHSGERRLIQFSLSSPESCREWPAREEYWSSNLKSYP